MRVSAVLRQLGSCGVTFAITGGLALRLRLSEAGIHVPRRELKDLDVVVKTWSALPTQLADVFLINHAHPAAPEGKLLLQLVSEEHALRVDVFRQYGHTLERAAFASRGRDYLILSVEDLRARITAHVCRSLGRGLALDIKFKEALQLLATVGDPHRLKAAWMDHCEGESGTLPQANAIAHELIRTNPALIVVEEYGTGTEPCPKCEPQEAFPLAASQYIASILGFS